MARQRTARPVVKKSLMYNTCRHQCRRQQYRTASADSLYFGPNHVRKADHDFAAGVPALERRAGATLVIGDNRVPSQRKEAESDVTPPPPPPAKRRGVADHSIPPPYSEDIPGLEHPPNNGPCAVGYTC